MHGSAAGNLQPKSTGGYGSRHYPRNLLSRTFLSSVNQHPNEISQDQQVYELVRILVDKIDASRYEDAQLKGALESLQQSLKNLEEDIEVYQILLRNMTEHAQVFERLLAR